MHIEEKTISSKARIKATQTQTIAAKASIDNFVEQTISAKAKIVTLPPTGLDVEHGTGLGEIYFSSSVAGGGGYVQIESIAGENKPVGLDIISEGRISTIDITSSGRIMSVMLV